ncbi:MAG: hypothetical protein EZS28_013377 [Streblomastix strix]|uniref:Uncharacterized protein n=1 Tax=Streblomastix strix TaxID=222440 RepID=A0A5J4W879_9EUKA|nr:MAG: hypothetical protein EZS28_013377 [Streblomastix strix]
MSEQTQQSGSQQPAVADKLGYRSRIKPKNTDTVFYGNKGLILSYEKYQKTLLSYIIDKYELIDNKDYQRVKKQASRKRNELLAHSRQQPYAPQMDLIGKNKDIQFKKGVEADINGDNFPEFDVRNHNGFIRSADGLRITVPFKRQRIIKYFTENSSREDRAVTHYKSWKDEDKPAGGYRDFIKLYLSPFLKERGYTVAQVYSVIGGRIWKGVIAPCYAAFWNNQLGDIPDGANNDGEEIFTIPTEQAVNEAKQKRDEKRGIEQQKYENSMAKIKTRKKPTFNEGKTLENARLQPYEFQNDLDDYVIEDN